MIRKNDVKWWVAEATQHPKSAPAIVEELAQRMIDLDAENERLRDEIIRLERRAPATAQDEAITKLRRKVDTLRSYVNGEASGEPSWVLLSDRLQSARLPLSRVQQLAHQEKAVLNTQAMLSLRCVALATPHEELLLLSTHSHGLKQPVTDIPLLVESAEWPASDGPTFASGERLAAAVPVDLANRPRFWTLITRRGYTRQLLHVDLERRIERGDPLIQSPRPNDGPVAAVKGDRGDLLIVTRWGKTTRFPHQAIPSQGAFALKLADDDEVVAALTLPEEATILAVTAAGYAVKRNTTRIAARSRPGGPGKTLIRAFDVLGAFTCGLKAQLLFLTYAGKAIFYPADNIPLYTQSAKGARARTLDRDPAVSVTLIPAS